MIWSQLWTLTFRCSEAEAHWFNFMQINSSSDQFGIRGYLKWCIDRQINTQWQETVSIGIQYAVKCFKYQKKNNHPNAELMGFHMITKTKWLRVEFNKSKFQRFTSTRMIVPYTYFSLQIIGALRYITYGIPHSMAETGGEEIQNLLSLHNT